MVGTYLDDEDALIENYGSSGPNIRRLLPVHERITRHTRLMWDVSTVFFMLLTKKDPLFFLRTRTCPYFSKEKC